MIHYSRRISKSVLDNRHAKQKAIGVIRCHECSIAQLAGFGVVVDVDGGDDGFP
jgi:hypothetical protein